MPAPARRSLKDHVRMSALFIYVIEKLDDGNVKEHGYAFTLPEANRIDINLRWLLASCFMISGKVDTPTM